MPFVVDVSVMASWHFADERTPRADEILGRLKGQDIIVPAIWWFEMRNVLLNGERRLRATSADTVGFLEDLRGMSISVDLLPDEDAVFDLARHHNLTFYDASYLELAQRERCTLATFDEALIRAAQAEGIPLA